MANERHEDAEANDKVSQLTNKAYTHLPHNTNGPKNAIMPDQHGFHDPAGEMSEAKHVDIGPQLLEGKRPTVLSVHFIVVDAELFQLRIEVQHHVSHAFVILEKKIVSEFNFTVRVQLFTDYVSKILKK